MNIRTIGEKLRSCAGLLPELSKRILPSAYGTLGTEGVNGRSHLFWLSHEKRLNNLLRFFFRHDSKLHHCFGNGALMRFAIMSNAHAFRVIFNRRHDSRKRDRALSFLCATPAIGRNAFHAVSAQDYELSGDELHALEQALVER